MIPQTCWDMVVKYMGVEQRIKDLMTKRDWRFEVARADINRLRFIHRCIRKEQCPVKYNWAIRRCKDYCTHLKYKHLRPELLHRIMLSELICKFDMMRSANNKRHAEHVFYLLQFIKIKKLIDQRQYPLA